MRHPFGNDLIRLEKPARYIGQERNAVYKDNYKLRFALVYPEIYEVGMSNLGLKIIYHVLNSIPEVYAERVFLPWLDALELMQKEQIPLFSLETYTPLNKFDVIGFSMHTELNYTNLLLALDLGQIPFRRDDRRGKDPIIVLGGPAALNPAPLEEFVDVFFVGEAELSVKEATPLLLSWKIGEITRDELFKELAKIEGIYVPAVKNKTKKGIAPLSRELYPVRQVVPNIDIVHNRLTIEIMRGCTRGCRFCEGGMVYRPLRKREVDDVLSIIEEGVKYTGWDEVGLLAFTSSDYPELVELIVKIKEKFENQVFVSLPSLPVDAINLELIEAVEDMRRFGLTLAPETASDRLRKVINKNVPLEDIEKSIEIAKRFGWRHIKLYFMIGLPTETEEDVRELGYFLKRIARQARRISFKASISPFVPRPHTPFQWVRQETPEEIFEKIRIIKSITRKERNLRVSFHNPYNSLLEGILSRGDESLSKVLFEAYKNDAFLESWSEQFDFSKWEKAFDKLGIDYREYLRERELNERLPWDNINVMIFKKYMQLEYRRAMNEEYTSNCMTEGCTGCGPFLKMGFKLCKEGLPPMKIPEKIEIRKPKTEEIYRYLIFFSKTGNARYIAQNDTVRLILQALKSAGVKIRYRGEFVPRPAISTGPSLILGAESKNEPFYIESHTEITNEVLKKASRFLMPGLELKHVVALNKKVNWQDFNRVLYRIKLPQKLAMALSEVSTDHTFAESKVAHSNGKNWTNLPFPHAREAWEEDERGATTSSNGIKVKVDGNEITIEAPASGFSVLKFLSEKFGIDREEARTFQIERFYAITYNTTHD